LGAPFFRGALRLRLFLGALLGFRPQLLRFLLGFFGALALFFGLPSDAGSFRGGLLRRLPLGFRFEALAFELWGDHPEPGPGDPADGEDGDGDEGDPRNALFFFRLEPLHLPFVGEELFVLFEPGPLLRFQTETQLGFFPFPGRGFFGFPGGPFFREARFFRFPEAALFLFEPGAFLRFGAAPGFFFLSASLLFFGANALFLEVHQLLEVEEDGGFVLLSHRLLFLVAARTGVVPPGPAGCPGEGGSTGEATRHGET